ncbi:hypothetical protein AJ87_35330 [Rhizobium yanglingense]|nr:hypothetical protein AJ87_35330 [Rhizobium yanglingense]
MYIALFVQAGEGMYRRRWLLSTFVTGYLAGACSAHPAEQLANPFGGMPPEFSRGHEPAYQRTREWQGELFNLRRTFSLVISRFSDGNVDRTLSVTSRSADNDVYCLGYPNFKFTGTTLTIQPHVGGCWILRVPEPFRTNMADMLTLADQGMAHLYAC